MRTTAISATHRTTQSGMTLLETVIALTILLIASAGILAVAGLAMSTSEDQGHLSARAAEYAQDKMEELTSLAFGDGDQGAGTGTDTTVFPATSGGDGIAVGGSSDPNNPVSGYTDYLDSSGNVLTITNGVAPSNWYYIRVWKVTEPSTTLKKITVTAMVRSDVSGSGNGTLPEATVTSLKSYPF